MYREYKVNTSKYSLEEKRLLNVVQALKKTCKIPPEKVLGMRQEIADFFGEKEFSEPLLERVSLLRNKTQKSVEKSLVESLEKGGVDLAEVIRDWRKEFICEMRPRWMPKGWNVEFIPEVHQN